MTNRQPVLARQARASKMLRPLPPSTGVQGTRMSWRIATTVNIIPSSRIYPEMVEVAEGEAVVVAVDTEEVEGITKGKIALTTITTITIITVAVAVAVARQGVVETAAKVAPRHRRVEATRGSRWQLPV